MYNSVEGTTPLDPADKRWCPSKYGSCPGDMQNKGIAKYLNNQFPVKQDCSKNSHSPCGNIPNLTPASGNKVNFTPVVGARNISNATCENHNQSRDGDTVNFLSGWGWDNNGIVGAKSYTRNNQSVRQTGFCNACLDTNGDANELNIYVATTLGGANKNKPAEKSTSDSDKVCGNYTNDMYCTIPPQP